MYDVASGSCRPRVSDQKLKEQRDNWEWTLTARFRRWSCPRPRRVLGLPWVGSSPSSIAKRATRFEEPTETMVEGWWVAPHLFCVYG